MTIKELTKKLEDELIKKGCHEHHTSYCKKYISRVDGSYYEPYNGKFGKGYKLYTPNWNSTNYSFVTYYIF